MLKDEQAVTCQRRRDEHPCEKEEGVQRPVAREHETAFGEVCRVGTGRQGSCGVAGKIRGLGGLYPENLGSHERILSKGSTRWELYSRMIILETCGGWVGLNLGAPMERLGTAGGRHH